MHTTTLKKRSPASGFTLIEMCLSLIIIGLLMAPAITAYNLYQKDLRAQKTKLTIDNATDKISGFLASYGRYPCPSPTNLLPGDLGYGYEDCAATTGIATADSENAALPSDNNQVLTGSFPFRTLNLNEQLAHDGQLNRLTYAVTQIQTDPDTYNPALGGISIVDFEDNPMVNDAGVQSFISYVMVTHGEQDDGAISYMGQEVGSCASALLLDQENCNGDAIFRVTEKSSTSDDHLIYSTPEGMSPWQYQNGGTRNIHLRFGRNHVYSGGPNVANDTTFENPDTNPVGFNLSVPNALPAGDPEEAAIGIASAVRTRNPLPPTDPSAPLNQEIESTGAFVSTSICDPDTENCFSPRIFGAATGLMPADVSPSNPVPMNAIDGSTNIPNTRYGVVTADDPLTTDVEGGNIICDQGVLVGISAGQAVCADEVTFACPENQKMTGIDASGRLVCALPPGDPCPIQEVTASCPLPTGTVRSTSAAVGSGAYASVYSGSCYRISGFSQPHADTLPTVEAVQAYVDGLNNDPANRTEVDCGPTQGSALVRDAFLCTNGELAATPLSRRRASDGSFGGANAASNINNSGGPYNPANPMAVDPFNVYTNTGNSMSNHSCWCREDYRVLVHTNWCSGGTGITLTVEQLSCPTREWQLRWWSADMFCGCAPGAYQDWGGSCAAHYGVTEPGIVGSYRHNRVRTCPGGNVVDGDPPLDLSECRCPWQPDQVPYEPATVACPPGHTNSFTFNDGRHTRTYTNVAHVEHRLWNCPLGMENAVSSAAHAGSYTTVAHDQACACTGDRRPRNMGCAPGQVGSHIVEDVYNCAASPPTWEETTNLWEPGSNTCRNCRWVAPSPSRDGNNPLQIAAPLGGSCNCNTATVSPCKNAAGDYWNSCQCQPFQ